LDPIHVANVVRTKRETVQPHAPLGAVIFLPLYFWQLFLSPSSSDFKRAAPADL